MAAGSFEIFVLEHRNLKFLLGGSFAFTSPNLEDEEEKRGPEVQARLSNDFRARIYRIFDKRTDPTCSSTAINKQGLP